MASEFAQTHAPPQTNGIPPAESNSVSDNIGRYSHAPASAVLRNDETAAASSVASEKTRFASVDAALVSEHKSDPSATSTPFIPPTQSVSAPVQDVSSGIQPLAEFVPKDASNLSHPTPPPEEPLVTGTADVNIEVASSKSELPAASATVETHLASTLPEQGLVRPREDDGDDEPAAKRSRIEEGLTELSAPDPPGEEPFSDYVIVERETVPAVGSSDSAIEEPAAASTLPDVAQDTPLAHSPAVETPIAQPAVSEPMAIDSILAREPTPTPETSLVGTVPEQSSIDPPSLQEPSLDEPKATEAAVTGAESLPATTEPLSADVKSEIKADVEMTDAPAESVEVEASIPPAAEPVKVETQGPVATTVQPSLEAAAPTTTGERPTYSREPMTFGQRAFLVEKTKNLKKTKHSAAFLRPVDHVALNIPNYPQVVKDPMDLSTLEKKLKDGQYASAQDFADDFELIVGNCRRFNGDAHPVTQAVFAMEAYFRKVMEFLPSADAPAPAKVPKKRSPSLQREAKPRRESRAAAQPTQPTATSPTEVYALQSDGTPQIRRHSSNVRPARAIKPPQNKEIPYAKPKRKEHMLELKFCEHVIDEIRGPKYGALNHVFLQPVDPVALNIPNYRQVIKEPMDLGTMSQKIKTGQYATAREFKKDFDLMIKNCLTFNPLGNPVRDMGIQLQREFEALWAGKAQWERKNQPASNRASSASGDEESAAEEEEEEEEPEEDEKTATIRALQKQLAEMQNALSGIAPDKLSKPKKAKPAKSAGSKKVGSLSSAPAKSSKLSSKPSKPKKAREVTYDEKQEISDAVAKMDDKQVTGLTDIITKNCAKYRDMEEMELEIDDLPSEVQLMLLDYVRKLFGRPAKAKKASAPSHSSHHAREASPDDVAAEDDDDFEPGKGRSGGGKRKKHRPMGKSEQEDAMNTIKNKLAAFNQVGTSGSESPTSSFNHNQQPDTSGDEESEESEEE